MSTEQAANAIVSLVSFFSGALGAERLRTEAAELEVKRLRLMIEEQGRQLANERRRSGEHSEATTRLNAKLERIKKIVARPLIRVGAPEMYRLIRREVGLDA